MQKRKLLILTATTLAILASSVAISNAYAQGMGNPQSFVKELAQKLGVDESKVQQAMSDIQKEHQSQMQTRMTQRLNQAVKDGKITEAQKLLILNKKAELQKEHESWQNLTPQERRDKMKAERQEVENWAKQNGIDMQYLMKGFGGHKMMVPPATP